LADEDVLDFSSEGDHLSLQFHHRDTETQRNPLLWLTFAFFAPLRDTAV